MKHPDSLINKFPKPFIDNIFFLNLQSREACYWMNMNRSVPVKETINKAERYIGDSEVISKIERIDETVRGIDFEIPTFLCTRKVSIDEKNIPTRSKTERFGYTHSVGKGQTIDQAKASCLCEALERYCSASWDWSRVIRSDYQSIKDIALRPDWIDFFTEENVKKFINTTKDTILAESLINNMKFCAFNERLPLDWTWGFSLSRMSPVLVPAASAFLYFTPSEGSYSCNQMGTNGLSLGNNFEEAILQGFYEMVERDSIMIFIRNPVMLPDVDISTFQSDFIDNILKNCKKAKLELVVKDFSTDLEIPTFCAQLFDGYEEPGYIWGFGCHLDPQIALTRAITEAFQGRASYIRAKSEFPAKFQQVKLGPIHGGLLKNDPGPDVKKFSDYRNLSSNDLKKDIDTCLEILKKASADIVVIDLSISQVDFKAVKVLVPGLATCDQKAPPVFFSSRVFDVPVKKGYIESPLEEEDLYLGYIFI
jgi:thiazole/oxazole-forming peptide maturase SagD family component